MNSTTKYQKINWEKLCWMGDLIRKLGMLEDWIATDQEKARFFTNTSYMSVTLVGSNPSGKSPDCSAFHKSTKSRQFVDKWFEGKKVHTTYMNLIDVKTKNNKQLKKSQILVELETIRNKFHMCEKIVACGKIAAMGLTMANVPHFEMPHPSGLCHFWNDKEASKQKVEEMIRWLKS